MRRWAGVVVATALLACGGSPNKTETAPEPAPSAKERACNRYGIRVAPFMRRFEPAMDAYLSAYRDAKDDTSRADAARALSSFIDAEVPGLQAIDSVDAELNASHIALVASLEEVGRALEQVAAAYTLQDREVLLRALARRDEGLGRWSEVSRGIIVQCRAEK